MLERRELSYDEVNGRVAIAPSPTLVPVRMEAKAAGNDPGSDEQKALSRSYDKLDGRVKLMERNDMMRDRNRAQNGQFRW